MNFDEAMKRKEHIWTLMTEEEQRCLFDCAQKCGGKVIVEIGAFYGGSTALLCLARPDADVISFDNFTHHDHPSAVRLKDNLAKAGVTNHTLREGSSLDVKWDRPIDLLFIDGDHGYEAVIHDLKTFAPYTDYLLMHDVHLPGVARAVKEYLSRGWKGIEHLAHLRAWRRIA